LLDHFVSTFRVYWTFSFNILPIIAVHDLSSSGNNHLTFSIGGLTMTLNQQRSRIIFLAVLGAITGWFLYLIAEPFLKPVFIAIVFAIVFFPFHARIQRDIRNQNLAALLSTLLVLLVIIIPTVLLGTAIRNELADAYQSLSLRSAQSGGWVPYLLQLSDRVKEFVGRYIDVAQYDLRAELLKWLEAVSSFLLKQLSGAAGNLASFIVNGVLAFLTLFFLFRDGRGVLRRVSVMTPLRPAQIERLTREVSKTITASVYGGLAVAVAQGILTGLGFWALGVTSPILWGIAAAIFSFVPFIGSSIVWLPAALFLIISGQWVKGLVLLGWGAGVVGMADNFIRPAVISRNVKFHPLYIFFSLMGGVQAFGILGLFIGPVVVAIAQALFSLIREELREMKAENNGIKKMNNGQEWSMISEEDRH
jgi:predicted PurR-regulated permease PerM